MQIFAAYSSHSSLSIVFLNNLQNESPVLFVRLLCLTNATTSNYNSNPSNCLVINKAHIVAEGETEEVRVGGNTFTLMDTCFKKLKGLQGEQRKECSVTSVQMLVNLFLPRQRTQAA